MSDISPVYAASRIRALEGTLLTPAQLDSLVTSKNAEAAVRLLISYGWNEPEEYGIRSLIASEEMRAWDIVNELLPDCAEKKFLTCLNDHYNIKTAVKAFVSGASAETAYPSRIDVPTAVAALKSADHGLIPEDLREALREGYSALVSSSDGQASDTAVDRMAMLSLIKFADESGSDFLRAYADATVSSADLMIAYRGSRAGKRKVLFEDALVSTSDLDADALAEAASHGTDAFFAFVEGTSLASLAELLKSDASAFEKKCDDILVSIINQTRTVPFGTDPVAAFWLAKQSELKDVRILLVCKQNGVSPEKISERMRELYV